MSIGQLAVVIEKYLMSGYNAFDVSEMLSIPVDIVFEVVDLREIL